MQKTVRFEIDRQNLDLELILYTIGMRFGRVTLPRVPLLKNSIQGVLYDSAWDQQYGEFVIEFPSPTVTIDLEYNPPAIAVRRFGYALVTLSVIGLLMTFQPLVASELQYRLSGVFNNSDKVQADAEQVAKARDAALERAKAEQDARDREYAKTLAAQFGVTDTKYSIYIPRIDAKSAIISDVNPADEAAYDQALMQGVAHAQGSSTPDTDGGTYLFAHSTNAPWNIAKYNAVFYLLRELEPTNQDEVYIFYNDKVYKYQVTEKHTVEATDISWITQAPVGPKRLILQTCWPPGTTWKRIILVANPVPLDTSNPVQASL